MVRPKRPPARSRPQPVQMGELLPGYAATVLKFSVLAMVVAIGYLLYAVFGGYLNQPPTGRVLANIRFMGQVLALSSSLSVLCLIIMTFAEAAWAVLMGIVGLVFLLGTPFLISNNLSEPSSDVAQLINFWGTAAGKAIIILVGLRLLYEVYLQLTQGSPRYAKRPREEIESAVAKKKKTTQIIYPWTPCWEMPYCHEALKEMCPAYKARKSCWRYGSGCNCDPDLIESLIRAGGVGSRAPDAETRRAQGEYIRSDLEADAVKAGQTRTIPCTKCPIYNDHQRAKYKFINPIAIIGTIVVLVAGYRPLMSLYRGLIGAMAGLASQFTLGSEVDPTAWFEYLDTPTIRAFFVIILGLLLLSYVLRAVEWAILVKKI